MSKEGQKEHSWLDLAGNAKNIITGVLVILSLIGAAYGSFKPESDAREAYAVLAPEVDLAMGQLDNNTVAISELEARIIKLEAEKSILQGLLIGFLTAEGHYVTPVKKSQKAPEQKRSERKPEPEPEAAPIIIPPPMIEQKPIEKKYEPTFKRRKRKAPSWEQKAE